MFKLFTSIDNFTTKLANRESDPINQARVKMLAYFILSYLFFSAISGAAYIVEMQKM
jgi:hypothetical protein